MFRRLYLVPVGNAFYKNGFKESPTFHYDMVRDMGTFARNAEAAPRGFAKSTVIGIELPLLLLLTRPYFGIAQCLATDSMVEERFDTIMEQLTNNELILNDFGKQKPQRGDATWNRHNLHLTNGASLRGFSVLGRKRGARPRLFILDDPEADPSTKDAGDSRTSQQLLLEKFEQILFRQIIPMLEQGAAIFWVGTIISRRSFLHRAICMDDSRFGHWNRKIFKSEEYDAVAPSHVSVLWPEMWPEEVLKVRRAEIGEAAYSAEYLNDPISETERLLSISPRRNEYRVEAKEEGPYYTNEPLKSEAYVVWCNRVQETNSYEEHKEPFNKWVGKLFRFMTIDYATGLSPYNDFSCIVVMGFDSRNTLWILDMWMGRVVEHDLIQRACGLGRKWMVKAIGPEAVSMQVWFAAGLQSYIENSLNDTWKPRIIPIKYPSSMSKSARISGLEPRFHQGLIKYPGHLKDKYPFTMLYSQTEDFTYDLALLPFDDAIDTVAMSQYMIHSRGIQSMTEENKDPNLLSRIKAGKPLAKGLPLIMADEITQLGQLELDALVDRKRTKGYNRIHKKRPDVKRPSIIR
jgi:hypothetical protein